MAKAAKAKAGGKDFEAVYTRLCRMLKQHEGKLAVAVDKPGTLWVKVKGATFRGKPLYFGGVRRGKNYVSYYLMPVYASPEMKKGMSAELKKRMQGKSCFNFTAVDEKLFAELEKLTKAGLKCYTAHNLQKLAEKIGRYA